MGQHGDDGIELVNYRDAVRRRPGMRITTWFDGSRLDCEWTSGESEGGVVEVSGEAGVGTNVCFWPDLSILDGADLPLEALRSRVSELAALCPGLAVSLANDHFKFDSWEEGLVLLSAGVNGRGAVEHALVLDDASDLRLRPG